MIGPTKRPSEKAIKKQLILIIAQTTEEQNEDRSYGQNSVYLTIERHARENWKALATTSAKTKSKVSCWTICISGYKKHDQG